MHFPPVTIAFIILIITIVQINAFTLTDVEYSQYIRQSFEKSIGSYKAGDLAIDASELITQADWKCFIDNNIPHAFQLGYQHEISGDIYISKDFKESSSNALAAGFVADNIQVRMQLNPSSTKKSIEQQFNELWKYITDEKIKVGMIWFDIRDYDYRFWFHDQLTNQLHMEKLIQTAKAAYAPFGFLSQAQEWNKIFGKDYKAPINSLLWYHTDLQSETCNDVEKFGGFTSAVLKRKIFHNTVGCPNKTYHWTNEFC